MLILLTVSPGETFRVMLQIVLWAAVSTPTLSQCFCYESRQQLEWHYRITVLWDRFQ
jgi:hypothetical protein